MCLCAHLNVDLILPRLFLRYESAQMCIEVIFYTDDSPIRLFEWVNVIGTPVEE